MSEGTGDSRFPFIPQIAAGETADVYFLRTRDILAHLKNDPVVGMEIFPRQNGVCCGVTQVAQLLSEAGFDGELWAVAEGSAIDRGEAALEIFGRYSSFGIYETATLGILSSCTAWATAAREIVDAAGGVPVVCFGARHIHPNVAALMDLLHYKG